MANVKITYDERANAAYIYLVDPRDDPRVSRMYACDPVEVDGRSSIVLKMDKQDGSIGTTSRGRPVGSCCGITFPARLECARVLLVGKLSLLGFLSFILRFRW